MEAGAYAWSRASKWHRKHRHQFKRQAVAGKDCSACVGEHVGHYGPTPTVLLSGGTSMHKV